MPYDIEAEKRKIACVGWLIDKASNTYSQNGEDGLLKAIFERIGTDNKWCFEVGANDGRYLSNSAHLIDQGWNAAMIEADVEKFNQLRDRFSDNPRVRCVNEHVFPWTFEDTLARAGVPDECDLGCIDIDEQDFWLWSGMQRYRPRVMVVEFGLCRPVDQVPPLVGEVIKPRPVIQAGVNMISYLGQAKGYIAVATTWTNIVFVRNDCLN